MKRGRRWHSVVLLALTAALLLVAWRIEPKFVEWKTQVGLLDSVWEPALIAFAMTLVIITGGIDLSVGATMSLAGVVFGTAFERGLPVVACALMALATGFVCGSLNGLVVTKYRVHPLIVTIGSLALFYGLAEGVSQARPISDFGEESLGWVSSPVPMLIVLVAAVGASIVLSRTASGRAIFAIGNNERAARYSGLSVDRIKGALYVSCGLLAATAAVLYAARRNTVKADIGQGMELEVITAVVLGGAAITGGRGSILGTASGLLLLHEVRQFVSWHWERDELNFVIVGGVLIGAVLLNQLLLRPTEPAK